MFERTTEKGSVWVTLKHCEFLFLIPYYFPPLLDTYFYRLCFLTWTNFDCFFALSPASDKSKVKRNKMKTAGEKIEYRCLIRATDGNKTISTMVYILEPLHLCVFLCMFT